MDKHYSVRTRDHNYGDNNSNIRLERINLDSLLLFAQIEIKYQKTLNFKFFFGKSELLLSNTSLKCLLRTNGSFRLRMKDFICKY
ncbi:hypothetical protein BpHYR1_023040 [Brachionus plicatilis]|uniref:Uncharacterized protein n=1 Tax=Brachionus plicatilis TaxID=10195 RepID=A0A3M7QM60_BRAPC|nr:hypothetical protein BpHYR1_023040 [Brachionus plicatilis]